MGGGVAGPRAVGYLTVMTTSLAGYITLPHQEAAERVSTALSQVQALSPLNDQYRWEWLAEVMTKEQRAPKHGWFRKLFRMRVRPMPEPMTAAEAKKRYRRSDIFSRPSTWDPRWYPEWPTFKGMLVHSEGFWDDTLHALSRLHVIMSGFGAEAPDVLLSLGDAEMITHVMHYHQRLQEASK